LLADVKPILPDSREPVVFSSLWGQWSLRAVLWFCTTLLYSHSIFLKFCLLHLLFLCFWLWVHLFWG
jgi:hypothetical protein